MVFNEELVMLYKQLVYQHQGN